MCQQARFADPDGLAAIVREFKAKGMSKGRAKRSAVQTVEISESVKQAKAGYRTTLGWYAGCRTGPAPAARGLSGSTTSAPRPTC